ncbi:MAG: hypothetical protein JW846_04235 [Dehalococcoidia bacterium]|nr:hypothetical protein [Dehalococcoidia bacterium]
MGKKQNRNRARKPAAQAPRSATPVPSTPEAAAPPVRVSTINRAPSTPKAKPGTTWAEIADKYRYVNVELKQIGILAGSFLVVLLILAAVLN